MNVKQKVLEQIRAEEVIELASSLVQIPSHYLVPGGETAVARHIAAFLESEGLSARVREVFDGRSNVYGRLTGERPGPTVLLCGHIDTVLPDGMIHSPFGGEVREGRIWGRGAVDMKGGDAAMLMAMVALKRAGVPLAGTLGFAGLVGEESPNTSEGAKALVADWPSVQMALVGEATGLQVAVYHKGMSWLKVTVNGKASHASHPEAGINSIVVASRMIGRLEDQLVPELNKKSHPYVSGPTLSIGRIEGGLQNNIVPESCWFSMDRRYIPGESIQTVIAEIVSVLDEVIGHYPGASYRIEEQPETDGRGPLECGPCPLSETLARCGKEVTGNVLPVRGVDYWTDGTYLCRAGAQTVVFGPGNIVQAHSAEEFIDVDQLVDAAKIYALCALELLTTEENDTDV